MTRAEKRLVMSWARYRRRFGGGEQERSIRSRFVGEVPSNLVINIGVDEDADVPSVDLTAERWSVRESAKRNLYTGKTYNSVENVQQFFRERGINTPLRPTSPPPAPPPPVARPAVNPPASPQASRPANAPALPAAARPVTPPARPAPAQQGGLFGPTPVRSLPKAPPAPKRPAQTGTVVEHPKYGTGTIVRREGEGDDAKLVVIFQRHGMKKLVEKYAGLKRS
jgi:DNA helicase-2/ATP-dependent DNA helicase PcrA